MLRNKQLMAPLLMVQNLTMSNYSVRCFLRLQFRISTHTFFKEEIIGVLDKAESSDTGQGASR